MEASLSPRQFAQALGVSESSVKRWVDAGELPARRTQGGHRRIGLDAALHYIRSQRLSLAQPELLGLVGGPQTDTDSAPLKAALLAGDEAAAVGLLLRRFVAGASLPELIDLDLATAMREIGTLWQQRRDGIFLEHRATEICLRSLYRLEALLPRPAKTVIALGGAPSGDPHHLASLAAALCLRAEGICAVNLGAELPAASFDDAVRAHRPILIWMSLSSKVSAATESLVRAVAASAATAGSTLIIGGHSHAELRNLDSIAADFGNSMRELSAFARGLVAAARSNDRLDFTPP